MTPRICAQIRSAGKHPHAVPTALVVLLMLAVACKTPVDRSRSEGDPAVAELIDDRLDPTPLIGITLLAEDPILGAPQLLVRTGAYLWVSDATSDPFLHALDPQDGRILASLGRRGEGPGDLMGVSTLSARSNLDGAAWVYDLRMRRLTRFAVDTGPNRPEIISAPAGSRLLRMNWINPHVLLGLGAVDSTRITLLDSTGARILVGPARLLGPDSIPIQTRLSVSSGVKACSRPGGREWAMIFLAAGRIDRYNDAAQLLGQFEVPIATDGYFVRDSSGAWSAPIPRLHYVDCAATNNKLYAVYSGRTREAFEGAGASNGRYLHVFSWSGKLERSFRFDDEVGYIAMEGDSIIYATAHNSTAVRRFTLPQH